MKKFKFIIVVLVLSVSLLGCVKDYDLNPGTTILRQLINNDPST